MRKYNVMAAALLMVAAFAAPAFAQFEERDTLPRFDAGIFFDLNFRGTRGQAGGNQFAFTNSPSGGLRLDYRLTGTLTLGAFGSYTRAKEKLKGGDTVIPPDARLTVIQVGGELLIRVKPRIPGYFILGGGAQLVDPEGDLAFTGSESFTEPFGVAGAGYEFASTRRRAFRLNFRLYLINPSDQVNYEPKSIEVDFVLGAAFIIRF
ncbi:MAG TPA: outer membrane beta-barrel protein [Gemmatimonadota bacterium]|nr:outer membrane beta-barrel protein [Gemmatimonadota bacterium]